LLSFLVSRFKFLVLDDRPVGNHRAVGDDDDAVADDVVAALGLAQLSLVDDPHVSAYPTIFIQNGVFYAAAVADAQVGHAVPAVGGQAVRGLEGVGADQHGVAQGHVTADPAAHPDHAALQARPLLHRAAVADQALAHRRGAHARRRQVA